ncbi:hypothetical protein [Nonomuraea sp. SYSU D8015]|uniref:hypothetical protein n=1 Tax=Nonomuraea sp. SYSU D8015 TaxID=2593644 RepID=UPI0016607E3A|nr:hypothetical protein [Nonomuraea sp. SYSU D8015]
MTDDVPQFTGITRYRDPRGRFSFRYPWDWHTDRLDQDREGVMLRPDADDPDTYVAAWVSTLPADVTVGDLPELRDGFDAGLATLPERDVLEAREDTVGGAVQVERTATFREGEHIRQRCIRALYAGRIQLVFVYQGATRGAYAYWLAMGNYCWATLQLAEEIWYGADPEQGRAAPGAPHTAAASGVPGHVA